MTGLPDLGVGIGWRPEIAGIVAELATGETTNAPAPSELATGETTNAPAPSELATGETTNAPAPSELPGVRFCEVVAEGIHIGVPLDGPLAQLRERGVTLVPHGVRLSLGGAAPVEPSRVAHLVECARLLDAPLVSEHIAFVRAGGIEAGHLLPVPRTRAAVDALAANCWRVQDELGDVPLALEPIAALFDWPDDEYDEADFLNAVLDRTGALLLLDVANVYANARNRDEDPLALLDRLPLERVAYVHVAGGREHEGLYHDTHTDPVPQPVLDLVSALAERTQPAGWLLERDGDYPPGEVLRAELAAITRASHSGAARHDAPIKR